MPQHHDDFVNRPRKQGIHGVRNQWLALKGQNKLALAHPDRYCAAPGSTTMPQTGSCAFTKADFSTGPSSLPTAVILLFLAWTISARILTAISCDDSAPI